jgi:hypothetical protein
LSGLKTIAKKLTKIAKNIKLARIFEGFRKEIKI